MLTEYYERDFANKIKAEEDKIKAKSYLKELQKKRIDERLPEDYFCQHCTKKVGLDLEERTSKIFICPYCEKENDFN